MLEPLGLAVAVGPGVESRELRADPGCVVEVAVAAAFFASFARRASAKRFRRETDVERGREGIGKRR